MAASDLTAARLRELLDYNPATGVFRWRIQTSRRIAVGAAAGCTHKTIGYVFIRVDGRLYLAHRLAVLHVTGEWPADMIDHRDGRRDNNVWTNLRAADNRLNMQNQRGPRGATSSGILSVDWFEQTGKWRAVIKTEARRHHLGYFETKELARAAYLEAKRRLHEGCTI